jgi:hypothetical protein
MTTNPQTVLPRHSFRAYIRHIARAPDTPTGDFVQDARRDRTFPDTDHWADVLGYLRGRRAVPAAITAARACWRNYRAWADAHPFVAEWPQAYRDAA